MLSFTAPIPANAQEAAYISLMVECEILKAITNGEPAVIFHRSYPAEHRCFDVLRNKGFTVSSRQDGDYPKTGNPMYEITISWSLGD